MCDEEKRRATIEQIKKAFSATPPPKDWKIGYDWWRSEDDNMQVDFKKYKNFGMPFDLILRYRDELVFLTDGGFRYCLPAFMLTILEHGYEADTLVDNILRFLVPPSLLYTASPDWKTAVEKKYANEDLREVGYTRRTQAFTKQECLAIIAFLECHKAMFYDNYDTWDAERDLTEFALIYWFLLAEEKD